jgi:hypothetical protein
LKRGVWYCQIQGVGCLGIVQNRLS